MSKVTENLKEVAVDATAEVVNPVVEPVVENASDYSFMAYELNGLKGQALDDKVNEVLNELADGKPLDFGQTFVKDGVYHFVKITTETISKTKKTWKAIHLRDENGNTIRVSWRFPNKRATDLMHKVYQSSGLGTNESALRRILKGEKFRVVKVTPVLDATYFDEKTSTKMYHTNPAQCRNTFVYIFEFVGESK